MLAWFIYEVLPSEFGSSKPLQSLWNEVFSSPETTATATANVNSSSTIMSGSATDISSIRPIPYVIENTEMFEMPESLLPSEPVDTSLLLNPHPTVIIDKLRKTYETNVVVNHLSLNLYEDQIFALLGK